MVLSTAGRFVLSRHRGFGSGLLTGRNTIPPGPLLGPVIRDYHSQSSVAFSHLDDASMSSQVLDQVAEPAGSSPPSA